MQMTISDKKFLLLIVLLSFVIRAVVFVALLQKGDNCWIYPDSVQYHTIAQQLIKGNGFAGADGTPQLYRLPGYPLFLAVGLYLGNGNTTIALWLQIFLSCLIPILIFMVAQRVFPSKNAVARGAALLSCIHVGFIIYAGMVATETLFLLFLLLFFYIFLPQLLDARARVLWKMFGAGLMLGFVSLIRPVGVYVLIVSFVLLLLFKCCYWLKDCMMIGGGWLLVVTPWLVRNFLLTGSFIFHTLPGLHFLQYSAAYVVMERDHCSYDDVRPALLKEWDDKVAKTSRLRCRPLNEYECCCCAEEIAWSYLKQYPWYTIKTSAIQILKTCCGLYTAQALLSDSGIWPCYTKDTTLLTKMKRFLMPTVQHSILIVLIYAEIISWLFILMGFFLFAFAAMYDRTILRIVMMFFPYMIVFVVITLAYGCARLRFGIEPFLIISSIIGWLWLYGRCLKPKNVF